MTSNQVVYCVTNILGDSVNTVTPLLSARSITLTKYENKFVDVNRMRFKFDTNHGILECYYCRPTRRKVIPDGWVLHKNYDILNNTIYEYLCDENGNPLIDYYDFEAIMLFNENY